MLPGFFYQCECVKKNLFRYQTLQPRGIQKALVPAQRKLLRCQTDSLTCHRRPQDGEYMYCRQPNLHSCTKKLKHVEGIQMMLLAVSTVLWNMIVLHDKILWWITPSYWMHDVQKMEIEQCAGNFVKHYSCLTLEGWELPVWFAKLTARFDNSITSS